MSTDFEITQNNVGASLLAMAILQTHPQPLPPN